jgi:hypothetical protein
VVTDRSFVQVSLERLVGHLSVVVPRRWKRAKRTAFPSPVTSCAVVNPPHILQNGHDLLFAMHVFSLTLLLSSEKFSF